MDHVELRWLEAFVAVAEEMHFGRAAARLHMAQSPLSQIIRRMERELGATLFERSTRSVALTASGEALLPYAYRVLKDVQIAADAARSARGVLTGTLNVGFSGVHNHHTLPLLARGMRRNYPGVNVNLVAGVRTYDGISLVRNGELDIAFVGLVGTIDPPLKSRIIARERIGIVLPTGHRLADRSSLSLTELRAEPFVAGPIDGSSSMTALAMRSCQAAGFQPNVVQSVGDPFLSLSLVAAGVGVSLITSEVLAVLPPFTKWLEIEGPPLEFLHGVVWSEENDSASLRAMLNVVDRVFPETGQAGTTPAAGEPGDGPEDGPAAANDGPAAREGAPGEGDLALADNTEIK